MVNDFLTEKSYAQLMDEHTPYITVNLDLSDPIRLEDFVGFFGAISGQFDRYMKANYPDLAPEAQFYVKEVRKGSIIADLFPGGISDILTMMDGVLITVGFANLVGSVLLGYANGKRKEDATRAELKDLYSSVEALAKDTDGKATVETVSYERGAWSRKVAFTFTSNEAQTAAKFIEDHRNELDRTEAADRDRVLMYFKRSDIGDVSVGKRSGERVVIEEISERDLPLIYGANLAEERIKHEIRDTEDNIYHKGFVVDVNVQTKGGQPAAYAVTHVHQVIDLPRDEE